MKICGKKCKILKIFGNPNYDSRAWCVPEKISIPICMDSFYANGLPVYLKYKDPREYTTIFQNIGICDLNFWIFPFAFAKKRAFLDFYYNFLKYCKFDRQNT